MGKRIRVTVWNEFLEEKKDDRVKAVYPKGMHEAIAASLKMKPDFEVRTATFEQEEHGLSESILNETDVLTWWGHQAHEKVSDQIVDRVQRKVVEDGMGLIVLHSGHMSKIFRRITGTGCKLKWRDSGERERVWVVSPAHPIAQGITDHFDIGKSEMYGEPFDIPAPDELVFVSWYQGGEVFRSGCCFYRGLGKVFYFSPGHETYPIYFNPDVLRVIENAVRWSAPEPTPKPIRGNAKPLEEIPAK
ncbi:MAG: ThuA domain-containing protein [Nitrososphaerota archaeon]|jgi:trehalose utilization protein|nr:ThuA domain-containing protein [Nitrososphaerota archaeon]MDG6955288.1 ThuA domain-containing protein [Nitrososphaerota archaeon]